jgi:hypothetical protein
MPTDHDSLIIDRIRGRNRLCSPFGVLDVVNSLFPNANFQGRSFLETLTSIVIAWILRCLAPVNRSIVTVTEAVPEKPAGNPVFLADLGVVATLVKVWFGTRARQFGDVEHLLVFCCLGELIPFVKRLYSSIEAGLRCKIGWVLAESVSSFDCLILYYHTCEC